MKNRNFIICVISSFIMWLIFTWVYVTGYPASAMDQRGATSPAQEEIQ